MDGWLRHDAIISHRQPQVNCVRVITYEASSNDHGIIDTNTPTDGTVDNAVAK